MSYRFGRATPTPLYWLGCFAGATPVFNVVVVNLTLNVFPPSSCPYVIVLPPPETAPLLTLSCAAGTPRFVAALARRACFPPAAALRISGPPCEIDVLPPVLPVFGAGSGPPVSKGTRVIWLTSIASPPAPLL